MAQSSSYKQYARSTRVLTEESGFAGGMLWTGNNIDETHLKSIVNFDYDDTTGYLKTRDPFVPVSEDSYVFAANAIPFDILNATLLGAYNICAFDTTKDDALMPAGSLYLFALPKSSNNTDKDPMWTVDVDVTHFVALYKNDEGWNICRLELDGAYNAEETVLRNINKRNTFINYDNYLYGLGTNKTSTDSWLQVFRLEKHQMGDPEHPTDYYQFTQMSYKDYMLPKIDSVTLLEACTTGFNAAKKEPFTYPSEEITNSESQHIKGVYFKDSTDKDYIISPRIEQVVKIHIPVAYLKGTNYLTMFQLVESGDSTVIDPNILWKPIDTVDTENGEFVIDFKFSKKETTLAFTFYGTTDPRVPEKEGDSPKTPEAYSEAAVDFLIPFKVTANDSSANLKVKNYDLTKVSGNCVWRNRMCVWGVQENHNCLFLSEIDNFYYYPIPHNVAVFDTNVMNCIPYKDTLLVFTADKIYRMSENNDGSFSQAVIQNDMPMSKADAAHLTAIKNMVLFKSGNYFYMLVPKSQSLTDELIIAPIYKNIAGLLNNLKNGMLEILQLMYPEYAFNNCTMHNDGVPTVYAEQDTVYIVYGATASGRMITAGNIITTASCGFKVFLNYNTNLRAWTLYVQETTGGSLEIASLTTERKMSFIKVVKLNNNQIDDTDLPTADSEGNPIDYYSLTQVVRAHSDEVPNGFRVLLDTGYRTLSTATQKRFREVQIKLYSESENITSFGTAFLVDGVWRRNYTKLEEALTDKNTVSLIPALDVNTFITELSMPVDEFGDYNKDPGSDSIELEHWTLDFSHFKREAPVTIRVPVSGKGYNPRFIFMAPNAINLAINEINWVYRLMHGR